MGLCNEEKSMKKQSLYYIVSIIIVLMVVSTGLFFSSEPKKTDNILSDKGEKVFSLMSHWSQGNIVALIRHTERCDKSHNECLDGEKGITVPGMKAAVKLGNDFKSLLNLDNTTFYNSPVKRTSQTAKFMFGNSSIDQLWLYDNCKGDLLKKIFEYKEDGKNMVLSTHSTCISNLIGLEGGKLVDSGTDDQETYGVTVFFAIDKHEQRAYVLGHLYPNDWVKAMSYKGEPEG